MNFLADVLSAGIYAAFITMGVAVVCKGMKWSPVTITINVDTKQVTS